MKQGLSVIIDSTCNFQEVLDPGTALAKQHSYTYCKDSDSHALFKKWIEHPFRPKDNAIMVNSTDDPEMLRDYIVKQIVD
ncbi:hypothetical protein SAPIO_CDS3653 [Scedosporium apiospermum]|uniref:Uncharacterized protein n=1 Tax=Pseudallescheria apiosperma TaxID=563466 RepID=A0A084GBA0_PSEDA|nr:uncharacterized protein SAPIO_CDS3653 [Scedosporium apiospermum]KEZ44612.1 hypothetical protein SAPIO_CDS3653 [Scedosporium apiospermum]